MTQIITFFSPKTAGASSLVLNAACLHQMLSPTQKIGLLELSPLCSQQVLFPAETNHSWEELWPFYNTKEWSADLLKRVKYDLGAEILWSPLGVDFPVFDTVKASAFMDLVSQRYDVVYIDLNQVTDTAWKNFITSQSTDIVSVICADPLSVSAWQNGFKTLRISAKKGLVINQVLATESARVKNKFKTPELDFVETIPVATKLLWQQHYAQFPAVWHKRSAYKKSVAQLINNWSQA